MVPLAELKGFAMYTEELSMHSLFDISYLLWDLTAALNCSGSGCFTLSRVVYCLLKYHPSFVYS